MMRFLFIAVGGFLVANIAGAGPCECKDVKDMIYRIKEATAMIEMYKSEITAMEAKEATTGKPLMYSDSLYASTLQPRVQAVANRIMGAEAVPKPNVATAETNMSSGKTTITGGSPCLREAIARHEAYHAATVQKKKGSLVGDLLKGFDARNDMRLADVAQEEIDCYELEIAYLKGELAKLPDSCKPPNWLLHFEVTISGEGKKRVGQGSIEWKISHIYTGDVELSNPRKKPKLPDSSILAKMTQVQVMQMLMTVTELKSWSVTLPAIVQTTVPIEITIDDELTIDSREHGEGDSFENIKSVDTWKGSNLPDGVHNDFSFDVDETSATYNLVVPVRPTHSAKLITKTTKKTIERSKFGYGNAPTHETPPPVVEMIAASTMPFPPVAAVFPNGSIHHEYDLPFAPKDDLVVFDSGKMPIDPQSGYLANLPSAKQNVTVRVYYILSKLPVK